MVVCSYNVFVMLKFSRTQFFFQPKFFFRPKLFWINSFYSDQNFHHYNINQTLLVLGFGIWDLGPGNWN